MKNQYNESIWSYYDFPSWLTVIVFKMNSLLKYNMACMWLFFKERDDEFANEVRIQDSEDKDDDTESPYKNAPVQIQLAPSETKPFTR